MPYYHFFRDRRKTRKTIDTMFTSEHKTEQHNGHSICKTLRDACDLSRDRERDGIESAMHRSNKPYGNTDATPSSG